MRHIALLLALVSFGGGTKSPAQATGLPHLKALILTGEIDSQYHDWRASTAFLRDLLERTGRFDVRVEERVAGISAATLAPYDLLILNYNGPRWGAEAERAVEQFVRQGKGLISFHGVTYGPLYGMVFADNKWHAGRDQGWKAYAELIGARWANAMSSPSSGRTMTIPSATACRRILSPTTNFITASNCCPARPF